MKKTWHHTKVKKRYNICCVCNGLGKVVSHNEENWCYVCSGSGVVVVPPFEDLGDQFHWARQMSGDQPCGLSDEDVNVLACYWSDKDRYETLGQFIQRVGARVLQNLQFSAGQAP